MSANPRPSDLQPFRLNGRLVDPASGEIRQLRTGTTERLEPRAMQVLVELAQAGGQFVSRQVLFDAVWGDRVVTEDSLTGAVRSIRRALDDDHQNPRFVETRKSVGYRLLVPPRAASPTLPARKTMLAVACTLMLALALWFWQRYESTPQGLTTVAVLPFITLSPDTPDYLGPLLTDSVILRIGQQPGTRVYSRESVMRYSNANDLAQAANVLAPDLLVTGTVVMNQNQVRVNVRLIEPERLTQVWATQHEGPLGDALLLQDNLGNSISAQLGAEIHRAFDAPDLPEDDMQRLFKARYQLVAGRDESLQEALGSFKDLTASYPNLGLAWQGRAEAQLELVKAYSLPASALGDAMDSALSAERILGESPYLHRMIGQIALFGRFDYLEAERRYQRALAQNPSDTVAQRRYAWLLVAQRRFEEAQSQWQVTRVLDPATYDSTEIAYLKLYAGQYREAAQDFERLARDTPVSIPLLRGQFVAYRLAGDTRAKNVLRELVSRSLPDSPEPAEDMGVEALLALLLKNQAYQSKVAGAGYAALASRKGQAIDLLTAAVRERDPYVIYLACLPELQSLHDDPRFEQLMASIKQPLDHIAVASRD